MPGTIRQSSGNCRRNETMVDANYVGTYVLFIESAQKSAWYNQRENIIFFENLLK